MTKDEAMKAMARRVAAERNIAVGATLYAEALLRGEFDNSADVRNALAEIRTGEHYALAGIVMGDPVFTTREAMNVWERARVAVVNGWKPESADPVRLVLDIAKEIERVRAAHAHLLTPERIRSDSLKVNGIDNRPCPR